MGKCLYNLVSDSYVSHYRYSRKILWLKVASTNNDPYVIAGYFLDCVTKLGGKQPRKKTSLSSHLMINNSEHIKYVPNILCDLLFLMIGPLRWIDKISKVCCIYLYALYSVQTNPQSIFHLKEAGTFV